jgi:2-polyprenyl-3-methyl-5-hydroxy-6-metoxy-1,4-benzoquinol methylase
MMNCRHCATELELPFANLNASPPSNSYLTPAAFSTPETWYPLRVMVCKKCWLVQTEDFAKRDEFFSSDYAYFSSFSGSWLLHAKAYVIDMVTRFGLTADSHVVEVASNDGYLLQYVTALGIPCLGIEPTANTATAARAKGIEVVQDFFGVALAQQLVADGLSADLTTANNVLAHVPDINDFVSGFAIMLKPHGVATFEFPHLMRLVADSQFDTIYHEHYSYLSLTAVAQIFKSNGLTIFDIETLPTHGGSLRVFACRTDSKSHLVTAAVATMLELETEAGVNTEGYYHTLQQQAEGIATDFLSFLIEAKRQGKKVAGYGAAAKGNTLLNFAGIHSFLLPWVVDRNPAKLGKYLPGSRIPIVNEARICEEKPDYVVILPWNLQSEIIAQLSFIREWRGQFVCAVPRLQIL